MTNTPNLSWCKKGGARGYATIERRRWESGWKGSGYWVEIPAGFEFESSVPWFMRWYLSPDNPFFVWAACVHDYYLEKTPARRPFADSQWLDAARSVKAPFIKREFAYIAMRLRMFWKGLTK